MQSKLDMTADEFLEMHQKIAYAVANRFKRMTYGNVLMDMEDLIQLARTGLYRCWLVFDPSLNFQVSTLAYRLAELEILRASRASSTLVGIKFPRDSMLLYSRYLKHLEPHEITDEVKEHIKQSENVSDYIVECTVGYYTTRHSGLTSLDVPIYATQNEVIGTATMGSIIEDKSATVPFNEFKMVELFKETLSEREIRMIELFMDGLSQLEVSKYLGISQPHVSRLRKKLYTKYQKFTAELELVEA